MVPWGLIKGGKVGGNSEERRKAPNGRNGKKFEISRLYFRAQWEFLKMRSPGT